LADISQRGWIAISRDTRIRYKPNELAAVIAQVALLAADPFLSRSPSTTGDRQGPQASASNAEEET
jgi:hypothetical protein